MTSFNQMTFFQADINQSEVEDSFQLASDSIKSVGKNVYKSKAVTLGFLAIRLEIKLRKSLKLRELYFQLRFHWRRPCQTVSSLIYQCTRSEDSILRGITD